LSFSAFRGDFGDQRLGAEVLDLCRFDHNIQSKRGFGLALAIGAMAANYHEESAEKFVADLATSTTAFDVVMSTIAQNIV
jgi:hypothetical protein